MTAKKKHYIRILAGIYTVCIMLFGATGVLYGDAATAEEADSFGEKSWQRCAGVAQWLDTAEVLDELEKEKQDAAEAKEHSENKDEPDRTGQLVMADVKKVLNVREAPGEESQKVGFLYAGCGGTVLEQKEGWTRLSSGELEGWASDEYLLFGDKAQTMAQDVGTTIARTTVGALRIRKEPSLEADIYDLLEEGAEYEVVDAAQLAFSDGIELNEEWIAVDYEGVTGFVSAQYVETEFVVAQGETLEQVRARQKAEEEAKAAAQAAAKREAQKKEIERIKATQSDELTLLAALIQCESGNQPYEGQVAVGAVVMNRVKSSAYPNTIRDVIFANGQFTPANSGRLAKLISGGKLKQSCINAAAEAMAGVSPVGSATRFRRAGNREGIVIGNHVFW